MTLWQSAPGRLAAAVASMGVAFASHVAQAQEFTFTYAGYPSPQISSGKAVNFFAEEVEKRTQGRVEFNIHHSGSLYQEEKAIEALLAASIDFAAAATSTIGVFTRHYDRVNLPFIVSGDLEVGPRQLLQMINSPVGKEIQARVEDEIGLELVFIMSSNVRRPRARGPSASARRKRRRSARARRSRRLASPRTRRWSSNASGRRKRPSASTSSAGACCPRRTLLSRTAKCRVNRTTRG